MAAFVDAIIAEARLRLHTLDVRPRTVFLGGGTPTALSETHLRRLLVELRGVFAFNALDEFAVEANPRTVPASKARMMREVGVSRVSLGVQAWDAPTLATLGRDHSSSEAEETFLALREAGIPSLNMDLMFSVPGQSIEAWEASLDRTLALKPDHLSAYNLNYEEDTDFFEKLKRGWFHEEPDRDADFFHLALDKVTSAGFHHYEISNYARPGHESKHNAAYWFGKDYLGLGPGAVSTCMGQRWKNLPDTNRYIEAIQAGILPMQEIEQLTDENRLVERIALELRTAQGVSLKRIEPTQQQRLPMLVEEDLVFLAEGHVRLTRKGKTLADSIAGELIG
jgi:oxygen-independent coproporphyrinogen-3 oxidase